jgi:uncharacterized protein
LDVLTTNLLEGGKVKAIDLLAGVLLVVGGLNWGLVGGLQFDLVAALLGEFSAPSRLVYVVVGLAALYQAAAWRSIQRRWSPALARS